MASTRGPFTLRGSVTLADNAISNNGFGISLFDYVAPDRTKSWKIKKAWMWPTSFRGEIGATDGQLILNACLGTDNQRVTSFDPLADVDDNRMCAWLYQGYNIRAAGTDFLHPNGFPVQMGQFLIDTDTMVVKELYLWMCTTSESATSPDRKWSYMVELEQIKVTPWESIFMQLKGMGQDVET